MTEKAQRLIASALPPSCISDEASGAGQLQLAHATGWHVELRSCPAWLGFAAGPRCCLALGLCWNQCSRACSPAALASAQPSACACACCRRCALSWRRRRLSRRRRRRGPRRAELFLLSWAAVPGCLVPDARSGKGSLCCQELPCTCGGLPRLAEGRWAWQPAGLVGPWGGGWAVALAGGGPRLRACVPAAGVRALSVLLARGAADGSGTSHSHVSVGEFWSVG